MSVNPLHRRPYRYAWALSWPVLLANLSVPLSGAVDTAVVGHLPDVAFIGAVGIGALIFGFVYWAFAFLRMGTTGFVAQCFGAGDTDSLNQTAMRALVMALICGVLLIALQHPISELFLFFIQGEPDVEALAAEYVAVRIWGAPAALVNFVVLGILFGMQRMRAAFVSQLVLNGMNIVLDLWFVLGFGWDVAGVAAATAISEFAAAAVGLYLVRQRLSGFALRFDWQRLWEITAIKAMLGVGRDLMIRTVLVNGVFLHFTSLGAEQGKLTLAANTILIHFLHALAFGLDGFAHAVEALGGSAYGRRSRADFNLAVRVCTILSFWVALGFGVVYWLWGLPIASLMTDSSEVIEAVGEYLPWMIAMPLVAVWSFLLDGIFIGTTRAREMRDAMVLSVAFYALTIWLLPGNAGNHGLWLCITAFMAARALTLVCWYPRIARSLS